VMCALKEAESWFFLVAMHNNFAPSHTAGHAHAKSGAASDSATRGESEERALSQDPLPRFFNFPASPVYPDEFSLHDLFPLSNGTYILLYTPSYFPPSFDSSLGVWRRGLSYPRVDFH